MINNLYELEDAIKTKKPCSVVRMGNVEMTSILQENGIYPQMFTNAGFYGDEEIYKKWKNLYVKALINCDCLLNVYTCSSFAIQGNLIIKLGLWKPTLPYVEDPSYWIALLENIKESIGIVSFFKADITRQLGKMDKIWNRQKMKNKDFIIVKAFQSITGNEPHNDWLETFEQLKKRVDKHSRTKVWFVSCGCYGLPLCDYLKSKGCRAIYLGGILQLLFGLKGKRWDERPEVKKVVNKYWKYPEERPFGSTNVEDGCYWGETKKQ
tara:strand:+ start:1705 stop:2502 length:798 start_codon:yes stop_codon:yes gene_type:complete